MEPATGYAPIGDERVAYQVVGDGPIDLINTIGTWGSFDSDWAEPSTRSFWLQLARLTRVIRFDQRGVGASDPVPETAPPPWEAVADEMEAVLDAVNSERAVIMGSGGTGPAAALFAATRPERTRGLIIFTATARGLADDDYPFGLDPAVFEHLLERLEETWGTGEFLEAILPSRAADPDFKQFVGRWQRAAMKPKVMRRYMEIEVKADARQVLPLITAPTLILHRTANPVLGIDHGRYLAEHIENARLVEVPGGDILPYLEYPQITLDAIEDFLGTIGPLAEPSRQLATVLFTDIVDSTRQAEALGDRRWLALLDRHHEIASQSVRENSGHLVKATGDGMLATFVGPSRAVVCAAHLRREMSGLGLRLRYGIHTGEIDVRGNDVGGIAVHLASRIMAEAAADEILVSRTVKDLVVGSEFLLEDRGAHTLKGIDDPWQLYAVLTR